MKGGRYRTWSHGPGKVTPRVYWWWVGPVLALSEQIILGVDDQFFNLTGIIHKASSLTGGGGVIFSSWVVIALTWILRSIFFHYRTELIHFLHAWSPVIFFGLGTAHSITSYIFCLAGLFPEIPLCATICCLPELPWFSSRPKHLTYLWFEATHHHNMLLNSNSTPVWCTCSVSLTVFPCFIGIYRLRKVKNNFITWWDNCCFHLEIFASCFQTIFSLTWWTCTQLQYTQVQLVAVDEPRPYIYIFSIS